MSRLYSPIGRRHRVATSALVGAIGIFLSAAAAPARNDVFCGKWRRDRCASARDLEPRRGRSNRDRSGHVDPPVPYPCVRRSAGGPPPADRRDKVA